MALVIKFCNNSCKYKLEALTSPKLLPISKLNAKPFSAACGAYSSFMIPYGIVEKKPIFKECENLANNEQLLCFKQQLDKHIATHLCYPIEFCGQGRVLVSFCIGTDGFSKILRVNSLGLPNS